MQYLALIYAEDGVSPSPGDAEFDDYMNGYFAANEAYKKAGVMMGVFELELEGSQALLE